MCLLCPNKNEFDKRWKVRKHLEEQHIFCVGFCFMCHTCDKTLVRRQSHLKSPNIKPRDLIPMHRQTRTHGEEAAHIVREYTDKQMPHKWEEYFKMVPLLFTWLSQLSNTPPVKHTKDLAPATLKQPSLPEKSTRTRIDKEVLNFRQDLVEISLKQPEEMFQVAPDPNLSTLSHHNGSQTVSLRIILHQSLCAQRKFRHPLLSLW